MLPDGITLANRDSLVHKSWSFVESAIVSADHIDAFESENVLFNAIYFVSDFYSPMVEEQHFVLLIQFIDQNSLFFLSPWL